MSEPNRSLMLLGECVDVSGALLALRATNMGPGPAASVPWAVNHEPAANTQATIVKAAAGAGIKHVCTGFSATIAAGATAPSAVQVSVRLLDGAAVIWAGVFGLTATAGDRSGVARSGLWIVGTAATSMTLQFSAAGGANTYEAVTLEGVDV